MLPASWPTTEITNANHQPMLCWRAPHSLVVWLVYPHNLWSPHPSAHHSRREAGSMQTEKPEFVLHAGLTWPSQAASERAKWPHL